jgi:hypothetical protein
MDFKFVWNSSEYLVQTAGKSRWSKQDHGLSRPLPRPCKAILTNSREVRAESAKCASAGIRGLEFPSLSPRGRDDGDLWQTWTFLNDQEKGKGALMESSRESRHAWFLQQISELPEWATTAGIYSENLPKMPIVYWWAFAGRWTWLLKTPYFELLREMTAAGKTVIVVHHDIYSAVNYWLVYHVESTPCRHSKTVMTEDLLRKTYGGKFKPVD